MSWASLLPQLVPMEWRHAARPADRWDSGVAGPTDMSASGHFPWPTKTFDLAEGSARIMRAELIEVVETELKRFAADLNLSEAQKGQLKTALENAHERIDEVRAKNPNISRADAISKIKEVR